MLSQFYKSRYTLAEAWGSGQGILVNSFSGAVDVVSEDVIHFVKAHVVAHLDDDLELHRTLIERGYYVEAPDVELAYARIIGDRAKTEALESESTKYMFGLTLRCNLTCSYCWQVLEHGKSRQKTALMSDEIVEAAFKYIDDDMHHRSKTSAFVSLFGGEPLIDAPNFHALVNAIGERALRRGLQLHFTTNGRQLAKYREETRRYRPSIQVTVDGVSIENGKVTLLRAGQPLKGLYETIEDVVAKKETSGFFLRFLLDPDGVDAFVGLADAVFANPAFAENFYLAVAPLQNKTGYDDAAIPAKFVALQRLIEALSSRSYSSRICYVDWRSLNLFAGLRQGVDYLPPPAFYHCEANIDLTCFDQDGKLYACYEAIGDEELSVGRFWPTVEIDRAHLDKYRLRSAFSMPECSECAMSPICGGGCEVRGYKHSGDYLKPYCDDLHAEASFVLQNWTQVSQVLIGTINGPA
jgi:uncharacterized protein